MNQNTCIDCGREFTPPPRFPDVPRCIPCWRAWKAGALDPHRLADALTDARDRIADLERELALTRSALYRPRGPDVSELRSRLRTLIQLCHPDRHGGSAAANDACAYLIKLRREMEAAA